MSTEFPILNSYYGMLSGLAYTLPHSILGLFAGSLSTHVFRKQIMAAIAILISLFHF